MKKHYISAGIAALFIALAPIFIVSAIFRTSQPLTAILIVILYLVIGLFLFRAILTTTALWAEKKQRIAIAIWIPIITAIIVHIWILSGLFNH